MIAAFVTRLVPEAECQPFGISLISTSLVLQLLSKCQSSCCSGNQIAKMMMIIWDQKCVMVLIERN